MLWNCAKRWLLSHWRRLDTGIWSPFIDEMMRHCRPLASGSLPKSSTLSRAVDVFMPISATVLFLVMLSLSNSRKQFPHSGSFTCGPSILLSTTPRKESWRGMLEGKPRSFWPTTSAVHDYCLRCLKHSGSHTSTVLYNKSILSTIASPIIWNLNCNKYASNFIAGYSGSQSII